MCVYMYGSHMEDREHLVRFGSFHYVGLGHGLQVIRLETDTFYHQMTHLAGYM